MLGLDTDRLARDFAMHSDKQRKRRMTEQPHLVVEPLLTVKDIMRRREALKLGATIGAELTLIDSAPLRALRVAGTTDVPSDYVDAVGLVVDHYAASIWGYDAADLDRELSGHFESVVRLLEGRTTAQERIELCAVGSRLAALLGYLRRSAGRRVEAAVYNRAGLVLAEQAGDRTMLGYVSAEACIVSFYDRQLDAAAGLAAEGQRFTTDPLVVTRLACWEARTLAQMGKTDKAKDAISVVQFHLERGDVVQSENKFALTPPGALAMIGTAFAWLGEAKDAKASALSSLDACDGPRDQATNEPYARITLAEAEILLGNLDAGIGEATAVLTSPQFEFQQLLSRGTDLLRLLERHADEPLVAAYRELVGSLKRQPPPSPAPAQLT